MLFFIPTRVPSADGRDKTEQHFAAAWPGLAGSSLGVEHLEDRLSVRAGVRVRLIIVAAVVFALPRALHPQDEGDVPNWVVVVCMYVCMHVCVI